MDAAALVVLSGGQDSTTCLFWAKANFKKVHAIAFDYNQRHRVELNSARNVATLAGVSLEVIELGPILKGKSPLTDPDAPLEKYTDFESMDKIIGDRVELTFVPMRNALFLTVAANRAVCLGVRDIVTGVCQADNANYPDCRQVFIDAQEKAINEALGEEQIKIHTPLMDLSKANSIRMALTLPGCYEALGWTHTAYDGAFPPGNDHASVLRAHGFEEAGLPDPLIIRAYYMGDLLELPRTENYQKWNQAIHLSKGLDDIEQVLRHG